MLDGEYVASCKEEYTLMNVYKMGMIKNSHTNETRISQLACDLVKLYTVYNIIDHFKYWKIINHLIL